MHNVDQIRVRDVEVAYRWDGAPAAVDHVPVVMMAHALGTDHRVWDPQVPVLADRFRVLRYDWRGHGGTSVSAEPYGLDGLVADAVGLMDALRLERVHWVGLSTGGMIGQGLAIDHGERLASLVLANTTSRWDARYRASVAERIPVIEREGLRPVWEMVKHGWFSEEFLAAEGAGYHAVRGIFTANPIQGYLAAMAAVAELDYHEKLGHITTPTQVIAAADDPVTPPARAFELRDGIDGAELTMIPGVRHLSNMEAPDAFNSALSRALERMVVAPGVIGSA